MYSLILMSLLHKTLNKPAQLEWESNLKLRYGRHSTTNYNIGSATWASLRRAPLQGAMEVALSSSIEWVSYRFGMKESIKMLYFTLYSQWISSVGRKAKSRRRIVTWNSSSVTLAPYFESRALMPRFLSLIRSHWAGSSA